METEADSVFAHYVSEILSTKPFRQDTIPILAQDQAAMDQIDSKVRQLHSTHELHLADARSMDFLQPSSLHLVLTSPPYWKLKRYRETDGQMGHIEDYEQFLSELDRVWEKCFEALVPGGRLVCVVGDVCLSRKENEGVHAVFPLHSSIQEHCRRIGFTNLTPIIWHKIANATYEVSGNSRFLGKPYEPNGVIKNDIEFILMQRKPGGYRKPSIPTRLLSVVSDKNHKEWFQQIWHDITGASTKDHPAPFPLKLAERLVRMFSFVGDTVLDPFMGTATTNIASAKWGRNSIGVEIDPSYYQYAANQFNRTTSDLFASPTVRRIEHGESSNLERLQPATH